MDDPSQKRLYIKPYWFETFYKVRFQGISSRSKLVCSWIGRYVGKYVVKLKGLVNLEWFYRIWTLVFNKHSLLFFIYISIWLGFFLVKVLVCPFNCNFCNFPLPESRDLQFTIHIYFIFLSFLFKVNFIFHQCSWSRHNLWQVSK